MFEIDLSGNWADELFKRMQEPGAREKMQKAFDATPEELGKAAKDYASKTCRGCCYGSHCLGADPDCVCCKATKDNAEVIRLVSEIQDIAKK